MAFLCTMDSQCFSSSNGFTMYAPRLCAVFCCIILPYFACASVLCARGLRMRVLLNGSEGLVSVSLRDLACPGVTVFDWHFVPDSGSCLPQLCIHSFVSVESDHVDV